MKTTGAAAEGGLTLLATFHPDLILPDMDGLKLGEKIKRLPDHSEFVNIGVVHQDLICDNIVDMRVLLTVVLIACLAPACWCSASIWPITADAPADARPCCDKAETDPVDTNDADDDCCCCLERAASMLDKPNTALTQNNLVAVLKLTLTRPLTDAQQNARPVAPRTPTGQQPRPAYLAHASLLL